MDAEQGVPTPESEASDIGSASPENDQDLPKLHGDPALVRILEWSNVSGISFDITLFINGMLVSGKPISHAQYYKRLADQLEDFGKNANPVIKNSTMSREESMSILQERLGQLANLFSDSSGRAEESIAKKYGFGGHEADPTEPWPAHVHLEQVTIARGIDDEFDVPLWRGELDAITAWYIGRKGVTA